VDIGNAKDIDSAVVDDYQLPLQPILDGKRFVRLVDAPDEFEGHLILEVDCEVGEEEDALLDDLHVGLEHELVLEGGVDVLEELCFLVVFEGRLPGLRLLLLDVVFHFVAQLAGEVVVVLHLEDGGLVLFELQVFHLDFVDGEADDVDHVAEDGSAHHLDHRHHNRLHEVVGS
jgi:hypothetical protein